jgi:xylulokinase
MYLGLDIGTSSVKAVLIDGDDRVVAVADRALTVERPQPLWSEQEPESWIAATLSAIDELAASHPREIAAVAGVGLSG